MKTILIIEDNDDINNLLCDLFKKDYQIIQAYSGTEGFRFAKDEHVDLIILDLMLPGLSGEELISKIKAIKKIPIVVITAKADSNVLVNVFELGADDYIAKPFNIEEVKVRVINKLKTDHSNNLDVLKYKNLILNLNDRTLHINDQEVVLNNKEFDILALFLANPKRTFTKANLYSSVWNEEYFGDDNTIAVHISRLRNKIEKINDEEIIETVWKIGFRLK